MTTERHTTFEVTDFVGPTGNATEKYAARNPLTRALLERFLREIDAAVLAASPSSILDVGCGEGVVAERLGRVSGASVVGVDLGDDVMSAEWARRESERVTFQAASAYELPFDDDSFDCACAIEVLEHLERPRDALAEMSRVARRTLLFSVPREPLWRALHLLAGRDVRDLGNTPGHINHWSSRDFRRLVSRYGEIRSMGRPYPWTVIVATPRATRLPRRTRSGTQAVQLKPLRVLYFGTYERGYPRNAQVISCLRRAGVEVVERHVSVWEGAEHKFGMGVGAAARLAVAETRLVKAPDEEFDAMIVGYPGHFDMSIARRIAGDRPVVFNPLLSLYDSLVSDRGRWSERSVQARVLRAIDRRAIRLADLTIADTEADADFFASLAGVPRERVAVCLVGAEERVFRPGWQPTDEFHCLFFGKLIPLHGLETILDAARLIPDVPFRIIGTGQVDALLEDRPANVEWTRWVDYQRLPAELYAAGCTLGIFGTTEKASRVIPNKAYMALACGTPLITADTPAARELLDGESALLVPPGDARALAAAVRRLANDAELARRIGDSGLRTFRAHASEAVLGERWRSLLGGLVAERDPFLGRSAVGF